APGEPVAGSRDRRKKRFALCRPGASRHHSGHQRGGHVDHHADESRRRQTMNDAAKTPGDPPLQPGLGEAMGVAGGFVPVPPTVPMPPVAEPPEIAPDLERRLRSPRTLINALFSLIIAAMALAAMVPLVSVLSMLIYQGGQRIGLELFTELPPAAGMDGGGIGNALVGTLLMVGIASLLAVPVGI